MMDQLDFSAFIERADEFEKAVRRESEVTTFCSGSIWQAAAFRSLHGGGDDSNFLIFEEQGTWLVFVEKNEGIYFSLESAWMFACPLIGDQDRAIAMLQTVSREILKRPTGFVISGVLKNGSLHQKLRELQDRAIRFDEFPATDCMSIDLSKGFEAWLHRRSKKFQKMIRQIRLPDEFKVIDARDENPDSLMSRILAVQRQTYKWREGADIFQSEEYIRFYRDILGQLHSRGDVRILFGQTNGKDIGYIFGGVSGTAYRGFQMSYAEDFREFGIGNHLQIANMKCLIEEGTVHYDLGMHAAYKERWADQMEKYVGIFLML